LRCVGCHRQRGSASCHTQRPRLVRDRKPLLILVISTEARERPVHYTLKTRQAVVICRQITRHRARGAPSGPDSLSIPIRSHAGFEPGRGGRVITRCARG